MHHLISDYILEIFQNAVDAGADHIDLDILETEESYTIVLKDNGKGMDEVTLQKALDPFYSEEGKHNKRKVGLGLPFLEQAVGAVDGKFTIGSKLGVGTTVNFAFDRGHIDSPQFGDIVQLLLELFIYPGSFELKVRRTLGDQEYLVVKSQLLEALGDSTALSDIALARQFLQSQESELH